MSKFIQIHFLTGYSSALINRDDTGLAKRISFGGATRTRISSQCQKRAWRMSTGLDSIAGLADAASDVRTKLIVENIAAELVAEGADAAKVEQIVPDFVRAIYGDKAYEAKKAKGKKAEDEEESADANRTSKRQGLLFSGAEFAFYKGKMLEALAADDPAKAAEEFKKNYKPIMKVMRENCSVPGGLTAALFGRMVTSDVAANVDAAIHVAHAFTVHADRSETDFFSAVDDLAKDDSGAGHIGDSEIGSGLFYGYVVVDTDLLVKNLGGDRDLAAEVTSNLVRLIASVSPGAKRGSTAPYAYASTVLVEAGAAQPRSLAEAYREPVRPETHEAAELALVNRLKRHDEIYATGEDRFWLSTRNDSAFEGARGDLGEIAAFAAGKVREG